MSLAFHDPSDALSRDSVHAGRYDGARMKSIYVAALFTTVLSLILVSVIYFRRGTAAERRIWLLAVLLEVPMCALAFYFVRKPIDAQVRHAILPTTHLYVWVSLSYAPVTEELAKLLPLLVPKIRRSITSDNAVRTALALGMGFGLGEIWFVAHLVAKNPAYDALPFYALGASSPSDFWCA